MRLQKIRLFYGFLFIFELYIFVCFRLYDVRKGNFVMVKILVRYFIKLGLKQFFVYFIDMFSLLIEVFSGGMMVFVGYVEVIDFGKFLLSLFVKGYFKLFFLGYF